MSEATFASHRRHAREVGADTDASALFRFAIDVEQQGRADVARWGQDHIRYARIRASYAALIQELSLKLDPENDLGLRSKVCEEADPILVFHVYIRGSDEMYVTRKASEVVEPLASLKVGQGWLSPNGRAHWVLLCIDAEGEEDAEGDAQ